MSWQHGLKMPAGRVDFERLKWLGEELLLALGEDPTEPRIKDTPTSWSRSWSAGSPPVIRAHLAPCRISDAAMTTSRASISHHFDGSAWAWWRFGTRFSRSLAHVSFVSQKGHPTEQP